MLTATVKSIRTGEASLCRNPEGRKKVDRSSSSREAATQERPARQCREV